MKFITRYSILLPFVMLSGCASQGALDSTRSDIDAVKTRLFSLEKDLGGVRSESKEILGSIQKDLKADVSLFKNDVAAVRKLSADIQASIDSTKEEMQGLSGKVDDFSNSLKKPAEELARYREDADKRIFNLEERILKLQKGQDDLARKLTELAQQQKKEEVITPEAIYTKGLNTFQAGNMTAAREIFLKFLEQYPQHEMAANAHYWIGETYYNEQSFEPAILAFQEIITKYPSKEKVPAAMLKQAMAFKAINDSKSARYVLKKLVENHPKSDEVQKAKEMLKELK